MNEIPSFDFMEPHARLDDPDTSKDAAKMVTKTLRGRRKTILKAFVAKHPVPQASFQIGAFIGKPRDVVSPHLRPLETLGYLVCKGTTTNPDTHMRCIQWGLSEAFLATEKYKDFKEASKGLEELGFDADMKALYKASNLLNQRAKTLVPGFDLETHLIDPVKRCDTGLNPIRRCVYEKHSGKCVYCGRHVPLNTFVTVWRPRGI